MRAAVATYDTKACAVRLEMTAGLHVNVCSLLTPAAARALIDELTAALERAIKNAQDESSELPEPIRAGGSD